MNEIFCSKKIKNSVEKILNQHDTCVFIFHGQEGIGKRSFANFLANKICLLYTSDAADDTPCVDLGGRRII